MESKNKKKIALSPAKLAANRAEGQQRSTADARVTHGFTRTNPNRAGQIIGFTTANPNREARIIGFTRPNPNRPARITRFTRPNPNPTTQIIRFTTANPNPDHPAAQRLVAQTR